MPKTLLTWIDIETTMLEEQAADAWPEGMVGFSAYYDGLDVRIRQEHDRSTTESKLREWFGERFDPTRGVIYLASAAGTERPYPVHIQPTGETEAVRAPFRPTFSYVALLPEILAPQWRWPEAFCDKTPSLIAFQSFKGGVGRTVHLLALTAVLTARNRRVLLIDADLEAPGITWLAQHDELGEPTISFVDFLALVHADSTPDWSEAVKLTAERVATQTFRVPGYSTQHLLLPAFRDYRQMLRLQVRPENLTLGPDAIWHMTDAVAVLGRALAVDAVLVDLRAGLSELAGPFLFDPRVVRVLVSSLSRQSLEGTCRVLEQLAKLTPPAGSEHLSDPAVILTFVTPESESKLEDVQTRLNEIYPANSGDQNSELPRLQVIDTPFAQELLIVSSLSDVFHRVEGKDILRKLRVVAEDWVPEKEPGSSRPSDALNGSLSAYRRRLFDFTDVLEFAESGRGEKFLVTPQLQNLAQKFQHESPIAVIIGPKGAGKTYTYLQLARAKTWQAFAQQVQEGVHPDNSGLIWPLLRAKNLAGEAMKVIEECSQSTHQQLHLPLTNASSFTDRIDRIRAQLRNTRANETTWREFWFRLIAESMGIRDGNDATAVVVDRLRRDHRRLVVAIDGLEEAFTEIHENRSQQVGLRALLQDVPNRLRDIPDCPLGLLVFIRRDLVLSAVKQNLGQFEKLYEPFKFKWDVERAMQLVVWILEQVGFDVTYPSGKSVQTVSISEAVDILIPLWGRKLGPERSREARTAAYVMSALADFNDEIQARDLVRLLRHAADQSGRPPDSYTDRILTPAAVRSAVKPCGLKKIEEVQQENTSLEQPLNKLRDAPEPAKRLPFSAESLRLSGDEVRLLEANGVIQKYKNGYALAENYRLALGFRYEGRGRGPSYVRIPRAFVDDR